MNMIYLNKTSWITLWLLKQGDYICTTVLSAVGWLAIRATKSETHLFVFCLIIIHEYCNRIHIGKHL